MTSINVDDGAVIGVTLSRDGQERTVTAPIVVSDVGPFATIGLAGEDAFDDDYVKLVNQRNRPCRDAHDQFREPGAVDRSPGMLQSFSSSRRLAYIANFTDSCPEMAPANWHLYVGDLGA